MSAPLDYVDQHFNRFADQLKELLHIPSISTLSVHNADVQRAAEWVASDLRRIGFPRVEVIPSRWHPVVYAEHLGAGPDAPTVLVYSHYDVQPAEMADGWNTSPFEPVEKDGKIYARGAIDSKSNVVSQAKAAEAMLATGGCPCNIKLLFEGDEETSSDAMAWFVAEYQHMLRADVIVICDGSMSDREHPDMAYGLRGVVSMELEVRGPRQDVHSGHYGGTVHNPIQALAEIITRLHNPDGSVAIPGFYDDVLPLSDEERAVMARALPWIEAEWKTVAAAPQQWGDKRFNLHERIGGRPTLEINGIKGGFAEEGFKTVLPARALAKISCRLVSNQRSVRVYEKLLAFIGQITPPTVTAELRLLETGEAVVLDRHSPAVEAAEAAIEQIWGQRPFFVREGGSIPVVAELQRHLDGQIVMLSFGYKGCAAHGPNEHVYLDMWHKGIAVMIRFYEQIASRIHP